MRTLRLPVLLTMVLVCTATAWTQGGGGEPHIGYIYPAGGQRGTTFAATIGGQSLRAPEAVLVTGEGVSFEVIEWAPPLRGIDEGVVARHARALIAFRRQELAAERGRGQAPDPLALAARLEELDDLPDHPLVRGLYEMSMVELADLMAMIFNPRQQRDNPLRETVYLQVTIAPDAPPGDRELRLLTRTGPSNPMVFQVGLLPEFREVEPNDPGPSANPRRDALRERPDPLRLPVLINGQIMPGDVDRFSFIAEQGAQLVVRVQARHLIPYVADAVPGWFEAAVAIFDADGRELAFADSHHYDPDPVLLFDVPASGEYQLQIRDTIYRGRQDFVYRVSIGELPFITSIFPLGGREGVPTTVSLDGMHLSSTQTKLDTSVEVGRVHLMHLHSANGMCNPVSYMVTDLPETGETEPNDSVAEAQHLQLPVVINGRIDRPGDRDLFSFTARAGDVVVAEVFARRLNSPLDSVLRLLDGSGTILAWNDDHMQKQGDLHLGPGLMTHYADSLLRWELPASATYFLEVSDVQGHGGPAWAYRLQVAPPRPDFSLRVSPPSLTLGPGISAAVTVHVMRHDGFEGPIQIDLVDAPAGITLQGGHIPEDSSSVRVTVTGSRDLTATPASLVFAGTARVGDQTYVRRAEPVEDRMQAFLWRHLVPAQQMIVASRSTRRHGLSFRAEYDSPLRLPAGGEVQLPISFVGRLPEDATPRLALNDPPEGIEIRRVEPTGNGLMLLIGAAPDSPVLDHRGNLIIDAEISLKRTDGEGRERKWTVPLGVLEAIPFVIVAE